MRSSWQVVATDGNGFGLFARLPRRSDLRPVAIGCNHGTRCGRRSNLDNRLRRGARRSRKRDTAVFPMRSRAARAKVDVAHEEADMSTYTHQVSGTVPHAVREVAWFAAVCRIAFLVPYLGVSVLALQHDVYYLVYFAVTIALVATYLRVEQVAVAEIFRQR